MLKSCLPAPVFNVDNLNVRRALIQDMFGFLLTRAVNGYNLELTAANNYLFISVCIKACYK